MKRLFTAVLAVLAVALLPASAMAKDRNHDRIPDKWEKRHHLSLHHNQARKDQDKDGLRNLAEYRQGTDPRNDDTDDDGIEDGTEHEFGHDPTSDDGDHDGIKDGDEDSGTVKSFAGGVLTIALASGGEVTGQVTGETEVQCGAGRESGDDNEQGDDESGDGDHSGDSSDDSSSDDRIARTSSDGGDGEDDGSACTADALKPGAVVREAELEVSGGQAIWHEVKLLG